ncbi:MAG: hypothetical protein JWQ87_4758 [Candidatus Sulfotelmatobacter sp.]|nr:hypothetical protein [Candidatus Sulfotelmatobacter sp.]
MTTPVSYLPFCHICNKPVNLDFAKTDEAGKTVHEGCYLLTLKTQPTISPKSNNALKEHHRTFRK